MGIDVALVTEQQEAKQEVFDPRGYLLSMAIDSWGGEKDSFCLQFIDAFGVTLFNQAQIPHLLSELESFSQSVHAQEAKAHLQKICRLVQQAQGKGHMYIKFIGD